MWRLTAGQVDYVASDSRTGALCTVRHLEGTSVVDYLRYCPEIVLEGLRKATQSFSHDCRSYDRDSNHTFPEYKLECYCLSQLARY